MPATATPADHIDAARIAEEAGRLLLAIRTGIDGFELPSVIKDEGDRRSHELIAHQLAESHPADAVLSEEGVDDPRRLHAERVWIVDPLDGTREFGEPPRTDWAVHVALVIDGIPVAGAVALPARGLVLSTGALSFVRENMKTPYRTAFLPRALVNAAPIGGGSLILPKGNSPEREAAAWTLMKWLVSPEVAGRWSRFTGYFAPRIAAYDLPEMKSFIAEHPDAKVALDQLAYARGWFSTYNTVGVRKALEDGVQAVLSGKATPEAAMAKAQLEADALMRPYVEQTALKVPE